MTIRNDMEYDAECLRTWREGEDTLKIRTGIRVARMHTVYGDGTIEQVASDAGYSDKTLYSRKDVSLFCIRWMSAIPECNIFSVRRITEKFPEITYTHIKMALPSERREWDFEAAVDALMAIGDGDPDWEAYEAQQKRVVVLPMTTKEFGRYLTFKRKGTPRHPPIFSARGRPLSLLPKAWNQLMNWQVSRPHIEVEIIIREAR